MIKIITGKGGVGKTTVAVREAYLSQNDCCVVSIDPLHSLMRAAGLEDYDKQKIKTKTHNIYFIQIKPENTYISQIIKSKQNNNEAPYTPYELGAIKEIKKLEKKSIDIIIDTDSLGGYLRIKNGLEELLSNNYKIILVSGINDEIEVFKTDRFIKDEYNKIEKIIINGYTNERKSKIYTKFLEQNLLNYEILYKHPFEPVGPYTLLLDKPPKKILELIENEGIIDILSKGLPKNTKISKALLEDLKKLYDKGDTYSHPTYENSDIPIKKVYFVIGNGGQGKSTISIALGKALTELGKKVVLYNTDPYTSFGDILDISIPSIDVDSIIKKDKIGFEDITIEHDSMFIIKSFDYFDYVPGFLTMYINKFIDACTKRGYILIVDTPPFGVLEKDFESGLIKDWIDGLAYKLLVKLTRNKDKKAFIIDRKKYIEELIKKIKKFGQIVLVTNPTYTSKIRNDEIISKLYIYELLDLNFSNCDNENITTIINKYDTYPRDDDFDSRFDSYENPLYIPKCNNINEIKNHLKKCIGEKNVKRNNTNI